MLSKIPKFVVPALILSGAVLIALFSPFPGFHRQNPIDPDSLTGEYESAVRDGEFHGTKVSSSEVKSSLDTLQAKVLGTQDQVKRIEVDLTHQKVYAFEGDRKVYEFLISSGKWYPTPTGTFKIWGKFRYTKMSGGNRAAGTYYYLPNVPFVMFFSNSQVAASRGFSLHGTYWHNNFGHPMSHGCVNMRTEDAEKIFYWSGPTPGDTNATRTSKDNPGTEIIIYGVTPKE